MNQFVEKTIRALGVDENDKRLSAGFEFDNDNHEDCVLILGLNPAGNENNAAEARTKRDKPYLFSTNSGKYSNYAYNSYFGQIYEFVNDVLKEGAKWSWCTQSREQIKELFEGDETILNEYDANKNKRYVIHVGDIFYYHQTNSKDVINKFKNKVGEGNFHSIAREILETHIQYFKDHNKTIKFVYINNATVSNWLTNWQSMTYELVNGVPVFYGGMLSGQRIMDNFSKARLKEQIRDYFNNIKK